ncbi:unnamed protein product [Peronospora destructor]|uniref:SRR1-like domain-containing protein n=1 Tax=Peronospora destructor TaxID=86335 RepID=A0AAV0VB50_9STRA|nr:unnamed protein product [Peronospora destructor]
MEEKWQQVLRRSRRKLLYRHLHSQSAASTAVTVASNVAEELVEPGPEVSTAKQLQIIQRVRVIADALQNSLLLKDALRVIVGHFRLIPAKTPVDEETKGGDVKDETNDVLTLVGYGLGSFCASSNAVHQLGFLVALKRALDEMYCLTADANGSETSDRIQHGVELFDPAMNKSDAVIAEQFKLKIIQVNEHARRRVVCNTVFFMPHCGKALYQNVLACNWGPAIKKLVIIGNSFSAYGDRVLAAEERQQLLLVSVLPYLEEVHLSCGVPKIHEDFTRYEAAFNDLSVHRFPPDLLDGALETDKDLIARMAAVASSTG